MEACIPMLKTERSTPYTRCQGRLRKRPNHELEYLRQQVVDLQEELQVLRQPDSRLTSTVELELSEDDTWESLAARQSAQANKVLMKNVELRTALEEQLRVARMLENAIDQHWRKSSQERRWFTGDAERPQPSNLSDELIYALLEEDMGSQHASVDKELATSAVSLEHCELNPKLHVKRNADGISFYVREVHLLPFSTPSVVHALHNSLSHGDAGRPMARCRKLWKEDNCLRATTVTTLNLPNGRQVEVTTRLVQRSIPEATRTINVWAAYVEIQGSMFIRLEEKGWIALEPYQFKRNGYISQAPGTTLRSAVRVAPVMQFYSEEDEKQHVDEMTEIVMETYNCNFSLLYQVLENLMLDNAMKEKTMYITNRES